MGALTMKLLHRAVCVVALISLASACTSLIAGRSATKDGSVLASHTNDGGATTDPRLVHIPARSHAPGTMRPVYATPESYPRYVGKARGVIPAYYPKEGQAEWTPIGEIKEVPSTYGYHEQTYGALNEKQVGIGESTCSALSWSKLGGKSPSTCRHVGDTACAMFTVDALTRVCMERAASSRECVKIMGDIATTHGFYGSEGFEGTGESLMVIDPNEGFIFHVLADPTGESAL